MSINPEINPEKELWQQVSALSFIKTAILSKHAFGV
jgi:hypothetical protein